MKIIKNKEKKGVGKKNMALKTLDTLIPQYAQNKNEFEAYKKICEDENAEIKKIMGDYVLQHYTAGGYKVVRSIQERDTMDEEMLLNIAHIHGIPEIVKTKEYIDYDALEKLIYDGKISDDILLEMNKAKSTKCIVSLRISKVKEEE